ncbi:hypothetical protein MKX01_034385 [Papaver californicum]|nr:hypothetical protein MKX01_034385 [Papaver californicum]
MTKDVAHHEEGLHHSGRDYVDPTPTPLFYMDGLKLWSFYRALIDEFIATLLFLYVTVATVIGHKKQTVEFGGVGLLGIAWSFFSGMIIVLVYCTTGTSDVFYMIAQCLGVICGVGLVKAFMKHDYNAQGGSANSIAQGYSKGAALGVDIIGTFVLVYTVISATDPKKSTRDSHIPLLAPLPIGFAVFMGHLATILITGTGINPARSFGAAWVFWVGPFVRALAAAAYHQYVLRAASIKDLGSFRSNPSN